MKSKSVNLSRTDTNILIDLIDEALTQRFIIESDYGPDYEDHDYEKILTTLKLKLEKSNVNSN